MNELAKQSHEHISLSLSGLVMCSGYESRVGNELLFYKFKELHGSQDKK